MARQVMLGVIIAVVASLLTAYLSRTPAPFVVSALPQTDLDQLAERLAAHPALQSSSTTLKLQVTPKPEEEAWIVGLGADGTPRPGPADDIKPLVKAGNSVCFLTDIEVQHVSDPTDQLACRVSVDEFTGFWEVHAIQGEGTDASVRCNASCLSW
jgi:hypothetical protein